MTKITDQNEKRLNIKVSAELQRSIEKARRKTGQNITAFTNEALDWYADHTLSGSAPSHPTPTETTSIPGYASIPGSTTTSAMILLDLDAFSRQEGTVNVEAIEEGLGDELRIINRKSFSSIGNASVRESKNLLLEIGWENIERTSREWVRIEIALAAQKAALRGSVDTLIVVTNDSELSRAILQHTKNKTLKVIGILVSQEPAFTADFTRRFDRFLFYDKLDQPLVSDELREQREDYARSLVHEAYKLQKKGRKAVGSQLAPYMERRHPEFYPQLIDFQKLKDLARFAHEVGLTEELQASGEDYLLELTDKGRKVALELDSKESETQAIQTQVDAIRARIQEVMHIDLPDQDTREHVFTWVHRLLPSADPHGVGVLPTLVDISYKVEERIEKFGIPQNTIYRLLNGLFRAGAFSFEKNPDNDNNPRIRKINLDVDQLDDAFVLNLISRQKLDQLGSLENLSTAFYGSTDEQDKMAMIVNIADTEYNRGDVRNVLKSLRNY